MTDPNSWTSITLTTGVDETFPGAIAEKDLAVIAEAITSVRSARDKALAVTGPRPVLLFLGVGVGNPGDGWHNPSNGTKFDASKQISPPLIADAIAKGYFVIGLNFNTDSTTPPPQLPVEEGIHLPVPARFPLVTGGLNDKALALVTPLANECGKVVVLNAVTHYAYPALIELACVHGAIRKTGPVGHALSVYAMSYAQTGEEKVTAVMDRARGWVYTRNGSLTSVADVFPTYAQVGIQT